MSLRWEFESNYCTWQLEQKEEKTMIDVIIEIKCILSERPRLVCQILEALGLGRGGPVKAEK